MIVYWLLPNLIIVFSYFVIANTKEKCDGIHVHGKFHRKERILSGIDRPYQLSVYNKSIFFSYNVGNDTEDHFEIGHYKDGDMKPLKSIENGFASTIDRVNKIAYLGGSNGIYELDLNKNEEPKHVIKGHNVWDMFFHHHLYFIVYPTLELYKKVGNSSELVKNFHERLYHFAIDGKENTFIVTRDGLYEIKNNTVGRIHYEGPNVFRAIEIDRNGEAYFCGTNGIYVVNEHNQTLTEIASIKDIFGLTFDTDNNIVYSDPHEIIRLIPGNCK